MIVDDVAYLLVIAAAVLFWLRLQTWLGCKRAEQYAKTHKVSYVILMWSFKSLNSFPRVICWSYSLYISLHLTDIMEVQ